MVANERGGRKETMGIWAWKIETLDPGEQAHVTYSLAGLEKGDWNETEVFFRGNQDVIGATKLDEKMLEEIRRQEEALNATELPPEEETNGFEPVIAEGQPGQTTLFGGEQ